MVRKNFFVYKFSVLAAPSTAILVPVVQQAQSHEPVSTGQVVCLTLSTKLAFTVIMFTVLLQKQSENLGNV